MPPANDLDIVCHGVKRFLKRVDDLQAKFCQSVSHLSVDDAQVPVYLSHRCIR